MECKCSQVRYLNTIFRDLLYWSSSIFCYYILPLHYIFGANIVCLLQDRLHAASHLDKYINKKLLYDTVDFTTSPACCCRQHGTKENPDSHNTEIINPNRTQGAHGNREKDTFTQDKGKMNTGVRWGWELNRGTKSEGTKFFFSFVYVSNIKTKRKRLHISSDNWPTHSI